MIGGEGAASTALLTSMYMAELAKKFNAYTVLLEHRYYGESVPVPELSTENLKYLSSEQALKDTEEFILNLKKKLSLESNKLVDRAGNLAAWFREKYPNIAVGAIASSAPVEAEVDFKEYLGVVSTALSKQCSDNIRKAFKQLDDELKTPSGVANIRKLFSLCDTFTGTNAMDVHYFLQSSVVGLERYVQYNSKAQMNQVCAIVNDEKRGATPLERYATLFQVMPGQCRSIQYKDFVAGLKADRSGCNLANTRNWIYQTCTEFGYYQTTGHKDSAFGANLPVEFFTNWCTDVYGPEIMAQTVRKAVDNTNAYYGGYKPVVTNVVFPNGSNDPWHQLSVLHDLINSTKSTVIDGYAHCGDMYAPTGADI
ncbi:unnamed protein product [Oppiella nova]|uniref:Uncharacterized protein n=1 Tax=Oppiella nova TaxID=334625 RepID=A0A7R9QN88_9ACAR|nr:unnamed protein product [Oppiella nova]CAG2169501.1 unnamed protein product [Oppiella nova]